ncbi:hypothetical protein [Duganella sp. Dugasp56]|uniref:hypothetical protein n=1 Tax=Duganella sp. Dugasp56 TaxID=3243046 RepID=UPI0039AF0969
MNIYWVVEGVSVEPKVYPAWIKEINPNLEQAFSMAEVDANKYYMVSGRGYPQYKEKIIRAVADVNMMDVFDRLVISVDSEDMSYDEKYIEIENIILDAGMLKPYSIIVQECCFESWCLGNRKNVSRNPQSKLLNEYLRFYDVVGEDPSKMPSIDDDIYNKAQFAFKYLSECCKEKGSFYNKSDPRYVAHARFFFHVRKRFEDTNHVSGMGNFVAAFG